MWHPWSLSYSAALLRMRPSSTSSSRSILQDMHMLSNKVRALHFLPGRQWQISTMDSGSLSSRAMSLEISMHSLHCSGIYQQTNGVTVSDPQDGSTNCSDWAPMPEQTLHITTGPNITQSPLLGILGEHGLSTTPPCIISPASTARTSA